MSFVKTTENDGSLAREQTQKCKATAGTRRHSSRTLTPSKEFLMRKQVEFTLERKIRKPLTRITDKQENAKSYKTKLQNKLKIERLTRQSRAKTMVCEKIDHRTEKEREKDELFCTRLGMAVNALEKEARRKRWRNRNHPTVTS